MTEKWRLFALAGLAATVAYTANLSPVVNSACLLIIGVGTVWACFAGPRRRGAEPRTAWLLLGASALAFLVGVLLRPLVDTPLVADCATVPGYVMLCAFLVVMLRQRQSVERHAVLDGLIVCVSGALAAILLLAAPAAAITGRPGLESVLAGFYPLFDVVVLLLVVNLTFTSTTWPVSLITLLSAMTSLLIGDIAYAVIGISGRTYASPLFDVPFLVAYGLIGVTALHPSVTRLGQAAKPPVQAWSGGRIALLVPALAGPFVLLLVLEDVTWAQRTTIAAAGVLIVVLLVTRAVTAVQSQVAAQVRAEHQAMHDALTGLPNRYLITEEVARMLGRLAPGGVKRVWVLLLDLDGFKFVNDGWGHDTGDRLVIEVGRRLRDRLPAAMPLAALGGDEFMAATLGDEDHALAVAAEIQKCFSRTFGVRGTELTVTCSMGVASASAEAGHPGTVAEALLRDADTAMYRAKAEGPGSTVVFDAAMHEKVRERIELEVALRRALGDGQLSVAYQPIVDLPTGAPAGAEALVRWVHPERGPISPATFIPIAEEAGLIGAIGDWVRQEALRQLGTWRAEGTVDDTFYLSINVSGRQLTDPRLPLVVSAEMLQYGVPARCVALEMTESVLVDSAGVPGRVLFELRELGCQVLIDDFGTGFSSLGYLRRFPVTGIKIDRSFVTGLGLSREDDEIVRAVVAMSHALGHSVIAEGVETRLQRDALAAVGVTRGQGWLWGPAVPPAEFAHHWHATGTAAALSGRHRAD
ncbi:putative bifunctional diguanylate cyclase/phosphodiesterase [Paractinoplanes lichenicola]|uniref:EAL domain-containing protein n=1 Tax=Paractinoplanes lichenicola TaxID=2802976 RepID=A0ABS1VVA9_9ACTN|nr:EAL domain-containing protein [Actinoplanes lichenicola]MBL7258412.1 EAL domain-containing protein [Actinoplanes lichenicola]